jgi:hypothetical protein
MDDNKKELLKRGEELRRRSREAREQIAATRRRFDATMQKSAEVQGQTRNIAQALNETAPPVTICPVCKAPAARRLELASQRAIVDYYRCARCRSIWTVGKDDPTRIEPVTLFPSRG